MPKGLARARHSADRPPELTGRGGPEPSFRRTRAQCRINEPVVSRRQPAIFAHDPFESIPKLNIASATTNRSVHVTTFSVLFAISTCHLLNDMMQSLLAAIYPQLKISLQLNFVQVGLITATYQFTASMLQPLVGLYADRKPLPFSLPAGMVSTLIGLLLLSVAHSYSLLLTASAMVGLGSATFHPESARVARMASGGRYGLAQSLFQVGGNLGQALGPVGAAAIVLSYGQSSIAWFALMALLSITILTYVGLWYKHHGLARMKAGAKLVSPHGLSRAQVAGAILILLSLIFSKQIYFSGIQTFYTFYLIHHFGVSLRTAQLYLSLFLIPVAVGTLAGGLIGDRIGRKYVIWFSVLGALPFSLLLPYTNLLWTGVLSVFIGLTLSSAFPAIVVFAQELVPGKVGTISGLFFGFAFGLSGLGAAAFGWIADHTSVEFVYHLTSFLPALGLLAAWLPDLSHVRHTIVVTEPEEQLTV
ncbi:MAG: MFS transporter [Alphaproteobacteria bacterium]|nr:MFS transporter [Alphaproteobacteria bacterium]